MEKSTYYRLRILFSILLIAGLFISCSEEILIPEETANATAGNDVNEIIEGHYIVILSNEPAVKSTAQKKNLDDLSKELTELPGAKINRQYTNVLTGFAAELTDEQVEELLQDPRVQSIEPDRYMYLSNDPNVQEYPTWGIDRIDQREPLLDRIYASNTTGSGVTVYVIDSGIRFTHDEFEGRASNGYDFVLDQDPDNTNPSQGPGEDCMGHGTHVAGTIGGTTVGVAKDVNLVSLRVFGCTGMTPYTRVVAAIDWITSNAEHPAVVNLSLGGVYVEWMNAAVENSIATGIHFAIAAGNSNDDACNQSPASAPSALTVGSSNIFNARSNWSNYGSCVDIYAPGHDIYSAIHTGDFAYTRYNGTSMAAPHVAGVVALYLESNPTASPADVHAAIVSNATENAVTNVPGGINNLLYSLWQPVSFTPPPAPSFYPTAVGSKIQGKHVIDLTWQPSNAPRIAIYRNGEHVATTFNTGSFRDNTGIGGNNATYTHQICELNYNSCSEDYVVTVFGNGGSGGGSQNSPPTASFTYTANLLNVSFTDTSTDSDGTIVSWNWNFGDGNTSSSQNPQHTYASAGSYSVALTVTDNEGATGSTSNNITVTDNNQPPPGEIALTGNGYKVRGRWTADLSWTPANSSMIDIYRNGSIIAAVANTGSYTDATDFNGSGSLNYQVCEAGGTTTCSNQITVNF